MSLCQNDSYVYNIIFHQMKFFLSFEVELKSLFLIPSPNTSN